MSNEEYKQQCIHEALLLFSYLNNATGNYNRYHFHEDRGIVSGYSGEAVVNLEGITDWKTKYTVIHGIYTFLTEVGVQLEEIDSY